MSNDSLGGPAVSGDDFPFYNGQPKPLSPLQWLFVLGAVVAGFAILVAPIPLYADRFGQFVPAILFPAIPLAALALVAGRYWTAIFRPVGWRSIVLIVLFAALNFFATFAVAYFLSKFFGFAPNAAVAELKEVSTTDRILFFAKTLPQLLGEEIMTILPFLAIMTGMYAGLKASRMTAVLVAWLVTAALFGAAHLPTYDWNFVQCFGIIGLARLMLTLPYIFTKNIWISTGAHVLNDWGIFLVAMRGVEVATH